MSATPARLFAVPVLTARRGDNSDLIRDVVELYAKSGDLIADVTYGRGSFWAQVDTSMFDFRATDLATDGTDCRSLPYEDGSVDVLVLDPPYVPSHDGDVKDSISDQYRVNETSEMRSAVEVADFYCAAMTEAHRVIRAGGQAWVKCQDVLENHRQHWTHIEVFEHARRLGFVADDLFVLVQQGKPAMRHASQQHARKNHSFLWIFRKPKSRG